MLVVDVVEPVVEALNRGESHIEDVSNERFGPLVERGLIHATTDYGELTEADAILIALPTPLSRQREPDLSIVESATRGIAKVLREGQVVVLESTTWPGTTREVLQPILEECGAEGRGRLPSRVVAGARRPGPRGLDDEDDARRCSAGSPPRARSAPPTSTAARSTPSSR